MIEVAAEDLTQGLDTSRSPGGEVGEGAGFDFALVPEGLAEEDGWRRVTIGDGGDVHAYLIAQYKPSVKDIMSITCLQKTRRPKTSKQHPLPLNLNYSKFSGGKSVRNYRSWC